MYKYNVDLKSFRAMLHTCALKSSTSEHAEEINLIDF